MTQQPHDGEEDVVRQVEHIAHIQMSIDEILQGLQTRIATVVREHEALLTALVTDFFEQKDHDV